MSGYFFKILIQQPSEEMRNGPEQEQDSKPTEQGRHGIDDDRIIFAIPECKHGCNRTYNLKQSRSGSVGNFKFYGRGNVLAAIPEAEIGFYG